jgi:hypothetical protein
MEWTVAIFGELRFPKGGVEAWMELRVDASRYEDWVEEFEGGGLDPMPARALLDEIRAFPAPPEGPGKLKISRETREISVAGFLEEDGYRAWCAQLATLFRVAEDAGACGEILFVNVGGAYGYRVKVKPGASSFTSVRDKAGIDRMRERDGFATALGMLSGKPVKTSQARAPSGVDQACYARIVALLERLPERALDAALEARGIPDPDTPKGILRAPKALSIFRRGENEGMRAFAAGLARDLDPAGLEPIAVDLLERGADLAISDTAVWALRRSKHPGAQGALLKALADPRADAASMPGYDAFGALKERLGPELAGVLHAQLTPAFAAGANAAVVACIVQFLRQSGIEIPEASLLVVEARKEPILANALATPLAPPPKASRKVASKKRPTKKAARKKSPAKKRAGPGARAR